MKLPELKEKLKSKYIVRVVAGVLTIALVGTGIGATAVFAEKNSTAVTAEADSTTGSSKDADDIADKLMDSVSLKDNDADKDESVYLISDANGNVNKTIVVDHLKNKDKKDTLDDASNLSDIENVKGKEKFTQSGDKLTWQAGGKDIYYQGTATEEPPVTQKVTYYLDGKEISPEDLAGKSGKVKIRFDYTNTTSYTETVNGEKQTVSVPFAAITGLVLGDGFENIEVTNGKAEVSNSSSVVLGYALPGLKDSLGIKDGDLDASLPHQSIFQVLPHHFLYRIAHTAFPLTALYGHQTAAPGRLFPSYAVSCMYCTRTRHRALAPLGFHCTRHPDCHNRTVHGLLSRSHTMHPAYTACGHPSPHM